MPTTTAVLGRGIEADQFTPLRSVVQAGERSPSGDNAILRVGREHEGGGWQQTEHVVLVPDEAKALAMMLLTDEQLSTVRRALATYSNESPSAADVTAAENIGQLIEDVLTERGDEPGPDAVEPEQVDERVLDASSPALRAYFRQDAENGPVGV